MKKEVTIMIRNNPYIREKMNKLKKIYNIKTDTKLVEHLVDLHLQQYWLSVRELTIEEVLKNLEISEKYLNEKINFYEYLINDEKRPSDWLETIKNLIIQDILSENKNIDTEELENQEALAFLDDFYLEKEILKIRKI